MRKIWKVSGSSVSPDSGYQGAAAAAVKKSARLPLAIVNLRQGQRLRRAAQAPDRGAHVRMARTLPTARQRFREPRSSSSTRLPTPGVRLRRPLPLEEDKAVRGWALEVCSSSVAATKRRSAVYKTSPTFYHRRHSEERCPLMNNRMLPLPNYCPCAMGKAAWCRPIRWAAMSLIGVEA